jgi:nicotinamidase-related amidase
VPFSRGRRNVRYGAIFVDRRRNYRASVTLKHPSPEIPQALVDKIVARRGRLHAYEELDPERTALVVIDLDVGSCGREPALTGVSIARINDMADALRRHGGTVGFVTSEISDPADLALRLGDNVAAMYMSETQPPGAGTKLAPALRVEQADLHAVKRGASSFFPGRCDLHQQLQSRGVKSVLIAGLMTNICCESSARDAFELGYRTTMVSDANIGQSFGLHEASLSTFFRFFGDVRPTADVLRLINGRIRPTLSP